jgi:hypothetical protein
MDLASGRMTSMNNFVVVVAPLIGELLNSLLCSLFLFFPTHPLDQSFDKWSLGHRALGPI